MSKGIRFTDEFKQDAVAQVVERGYAVSEVAERLGVSTKSLYTWKAQFAQSPQARSRGCRTGCRDQAVEAGTGAGDRGADNLKKGDRILRAGSLSEVCVYRGAPRGVFSAVDVPGAAGASQRILCMG